MILSEAVSFRKDLFFDGAVQINWFEEDEVLSAKAAKHFIFHGPDYHGVVGDEYEGSEFKLVDTAFFTEDLLKRVHGEIDDEPFMLAIAGYGTGKSHLGLTLASLLREPSSDVAIEVLNNIKRADQSIGNKVQAILDKQKKPHLVVALNGMKDFDLNNEIIRQIVATLNKEGLDTSFLEDLRPRFKHAVKFTQSFYSSLKSDFDKYFDENTSVDYIVERLNNQDEEVFQKVGEIFENKMGYRLQAAGQESLNDFIRITKEKYCGEGKPFAGLLIIFDEFGRYLEFAVQRPYIAGPGALQQLYETVQANSDGVFLLCFIQSELNAYVSRVAPELREELKRYVTRYDTVRKVYLSTNLETLIANLLEKKEMDIIEQSLDNMEETFDYLQASMKRWFPGIENHNLWLDQERFEKVIWKGCWPLHPLSTWMLYKLTTIGKSLQQRSALSFVAEVFDEYKNLQLELGETLWPVHFCREAMISEFLNSEQYGQQGATAHAYETTLQKYRHEFSDKEVAILKTVLLSTKIGIKLASQEDYFAALRMFSGLTDNQVQESVDLLENEFAVLMWNDSLKQYEISSEAVPKRQFLADLERKASEIDSEGKGELFRFYFNNWSEENTINTDFGSKNAIYTREWNYKVLYTDVNLLEGQISYAFRNWFEAVDVDVEKGQLIYCYLGPESNLESVKAKVREILETKIQEYNLDSNTGAPILIMFLHDSDGSFGENIAKYWTLQEVFRQGEYYNQYKNFIEDREREILKELKNQFAELKKDRQIVIATSQEIPSGRLNKILENLFDVVYPKRIPFPFDGFNTAKGNAAKNCQLFTRELFMGKMDQHWISSRNKQERNRAYNVLDQSWCVIGEDGFIRIKPNNQKVREIFDLMENKLESKGEEGTPVPMNLGEIMRLLLRPPYGCNKASAGLLIAIFIGKRKDHGIDLYKDGESISIENWLQIAIPRYFLDLTVLDATEVVQISEEIQSEWLKLLDEWESEKLLEKKIEFRDKAEELKERIQLPQHLYHQYRHLKEAADQAESRLNSLDDQINDALGKLKRGNESSNISFLSWGGADFADLLHSMRKERDLWSKEQLQEIKQCYDYARKKVKENFQQWVLKQKVSDIEALGKFKHNMLKKIGGNLKKLELEDEFQQLKEHVDKVEEEVNFAEEFKEIMKEVDAFVDNNQITDRTPVSILKNWIERGTEYYRKLEEASGKSNLIEEEIKNARQKVSKFVNTCNNQIEQYQERTGKVYNVEKINSLNDLTYWRNETADLIAINEGMDVDVEDLKLVQKQLDLIEKHIRKLEDFNLNEEELNDTYNECIKETEEYFSDDAPPLDYELIYSSLVNTIKEKREEAANEWMKKNMPDLGAISQFDVDKAMDTKNRLYNRPQYLSKEQQKKVQEVILACDNRIDALELEGILAKFNKLSDENKRQFLQNIKEQIEKLIEV